MKKLNVSTSIACVKTSQATEIFVLNNNNIGSVHSFLARAEHLVPGALPPRAEHLVPGALKKT